MGLSGSSDESVVELLLDFPLPSRRPMNVGMLLDLLLSLAQETVEYSEKKGRQAFESCTVPSGRRQI